MSRIVAINQGNSIVIASQIIHLSAPTEHATTTIAGQIVVPVTNGVSILSTTITGTIKTPVLISGITLAVDKSNIYIGSKSYPIPTAKPASIMALANRVVALPLSNAVSIYNTTLTAGAPAATFSGTAIPLDASSNLIFDGIAQTLPSFAQTTSDFGQVTTINSVAVELLSSGISVAGSTLTPEAPLITASGMPLSLGSTILAIGTKSIPISFKNPQSLITTIGGHVITAAATAIKISNATTSPGAQGTILDGTSVSLGSGGSLVVGSTTVMLAAPSGSFGGLMSGGLGLGGLGLGGPLANGSSPNESVPTNSKNSTTSSKQNFRGQAGGLRCHIPRAFASLAVAIHILSHL